MENKNKSEYKIAHDFKSKQNPHVEGKKKQYINVELTAMQL